MENDLIRRSDVCKAIMNDLNLINLADIDGGVKKACIRRANWRVECVPAVDAVEVKHARWIPHPDKRFRETDVCTACGTGTTRREYGLNPDGRAYVTEYSYRYCPWCGARMDGEDGGA